MKKNLFLSLALAFALLLASPGNGLAQAGAHHHHHADHHNVKTRVIHFSNTDDLKDYVHNWVRDFLQDFQIDWKYDGQNGQHWNGKKPEKEKHPQQPEEEQQPAPEPDKEPEKDKQPAPEPQQPQQPSEKPEEEQQPTENASDQLNEFEQQVVNLTNQERAKAGLPELKVDKELSKVARLKSQDMKNKGYFSHNSPTYGSPFDMMKQFGIDYRAAGENIAMGQRTPEAVVNAWMNSDGHRRNMMNPDFTHIGVGFVAEGNYWTQQFISK